MSCFAHTHLYAQKKLCGYVRVGKKRVVCLCLVEFDYVARLVGCVSVTGRILGCPFLHQVVGTC